MSVAPKCGASSADDDRAQGRDAKDDRDGDDGDERCDEITLHVRDSIDQLRVKGTATLDPTVALRKGGTGKDRSFTFWRS